MGKIEARQMGPGLFQLRLEITAPRIMFETCVD